LVRSGRADLALLYKVIHNHGTLIDSSHIWKVSMTVSGLLKRPSGYVPLALSLAALATIVLHLARFGAAREVDEGSAAHIWQLLMSAQVLAIVYFGVVWLPRASREARVVLAMQLAAGVTAALPVLFLGL
jgi:hypothetical protein